MKQARSLALLALLPLLGLAVWWLAGGTATRADRPVGAELVQAADAAAGPAGRAPDATVDERRAGDEAPRIAVPDGGGPGGLTGRVLDRDGHPIAGASVTCTAQGGLATTRLSELANAGDLRQAMEELRNTQPPSTNATTEADGTFRIPAPDGQGDLRLAVRARGHLVLRRAAPRPAGDDFDLGDLALERGAVVAGRVVDGSGRAIAEARVHRRSGPAGGFDHLEFVGWAPSDSEGRGGERTDADGRFELAHVRPGTFSLRTTHRDHPPASLDGLSVAAGEVLDNLVIVVEHGAVLSGRVLDVPEGTEGLRVLARHKRDASASDPAMAWLGDANGQLFELGLGDRSAALGEDGGFELRGLDVDRTYRIWAVQTGAGVLQMSPCTERREAPAGARGIELHYEPGISVTFRAVDARSGQPVETLGVRPRLVGHGGGLVAMLLEAAGAPSRIEDYPDGRVTLTGLRPKARQRLELRVESLGYADFERKGIELPRLGGLDLGTVLLEPAPVVRVHVTNAKSGDPVVGALVRIATAGDDSGSIRYATQSAVRLEAADSSDFAITLGRGSGARSGNTDAEGRCVLNGFPGRDAIISVTSDDYARYDSGPLPLPARDDLEHDVRLVVGASVEVLVLDASGVPIAEAIVASADPDGDKTSRRADARGVARFERLVPGTHRFKLQDGARTRGRTVRVETTFTMGTDSPRPPAEAGWEAVEVVDGQHAELTLTKPPMARLSGIVRENGVPLRRARVSFVEGPAPPAPTPDGRAVEEVSHRIGDLAGGAGSSDRTDREGRYEFAELTAGSHRLRITHRDRVMPAVVAVVLREGENTFDVELGTSVLSGRVLGPDGEPIAGARVRVSRSAAGAARALNAILGSAGDAFGFGGGGEVRTEDDGTFELCGVQPDVPLTVAARAEGFAAATSAPVAVAAGETHGALEIRLEASGSVRVRMTGGAAPLVAVQATFEGVTDDDVQPVYGFLRNGRATLDGLRAGRWKIALTGVDDDSLAPRFVDVVPGETVDVQFER